MLVLTRKVGERVIVEDAIRVEILEVRGRRVRLGFTAPDGVLIRREELCVEMPQAEPGVTPRGLPADRFKLSQARSRTL